MNEPQLDQIQIRDLLLRCTIGCREWEQQELQDVNFNIYIYTDLRKACQTDSLEDTVDYAALKKKIVNLVEGSSFRLIERLAQRVAEICLQEVRVAKVRVLLEKPGALRFARTVCVDITRHRKYEPGDLNE
jgi:FolB domain-containing protein